MSLPTGGKFYYHPHDPPEAAVDPSLVGKPGKPLVHFIPDVEKRPLPSFTENVPLVTSLPPPDSPLAYNEDEMVSLITDLYKILIKISYIESEDVNFPPTDTGRHELNKEAAWEKVHMSPAVISLLERLPYLEDPDSFAIFYASVALDYLVINAETLEELIETRDPRMWGTPYSGSGRPHRRYLKPEDVALSYSLDSGGYTWVLDTESNAIRLLEGDRHLSAYGPNFDTGPPSAPTRDYLKYPTYHAPSLLKAYIDQIRSLELLPHDGCIQSSKERISNFVMTKRLREEYGWPDKFEHERWAGEKNEVEADAKKIEQDYTKGLEFGREADEATKRYIASVEETEDK